MFCENALTMLALYFSEGDWNWPGARDGQGGRQWGDSNPEVKKAQLQELLTPYGPIQGASHVVRGIKGLARRGTGLVINEGLPQA